MDESPAVFRESEATGILVALAARNEKGCPGNSDEGVDMAGVEIPSCEVTK